MYEVVCLACRRKFLSNSRKAPYCSRECKERFGRNPNERDIAKRDCITGESKQKPVAISHEIPKKKEKPKKPVIASAPVKHIGYEKLQKMSWVEKYNNVDILSKVSMLSGALAELNIIYSYGELKIIYDTNKTKYKELEAKAIESKM